MANETPLAKVGLSTRVLNILTEAGFQMAGQAWEKMLVEEDAILGLEGIGPKALVELGEKLRAFSYPEPAPVVVEPEPVPVEEPAPEAPALVEGVEPAVVAVVEAEGVTAEPGTAAAEVEARPVEQVFDELAKKLAVGEPLPVVVEESADEEEETDETGKKTKKHKKVDKVVEYDPDTGEMVVHRRRKPGRAEGWEETEV
jgi:hypothetical protein